MALLGGHEAHCGERASGCARRGARPGFASGRRNLWIALAISLLFMLAEAIGGYLANSLALLADSGHMLTDAAALLLSLLAIHFGARPATLQKSYGWMRLEILAALANGVVLVAISVGIFYEAYQRLRDPPTVRIGLMLGVAVAGLAANLAAAAVLHRLQREQLNVRAAYVHILGDLLGSLGAVGAALVMLATGWRAADPLISVLVGLLILLSAVKIVQQAVDILLEGVPSHIDLNGLERELRAVEGVQAIHDLHVWTISSGVHLMTCHAVVGNHGCHHEVLARLSAVVRERFGIEHSTIQLECVDLWHIEQTGLCDRRPPT